jgi:uncharacterized membrane protein (DUF485 family)
MHYNFFNRKNNSFVVRLAVVMFSSYYFELLLAIPVKTERDL